MRDIDKPLNKEFQQELGEVIDQTEIPDHDKAAILLSLARVQFSHAEEHREIDDFVELAGHIDSRADVVIGDEEGDRSRVTQSEPSSRP